MLLQNRRVQYFMSKGWWRFLGLRGCAGQTRCQIWWKCPLKGPENQRFWGLLGIYSLATWNVMVLWKSSRNDKIKYGPQSLSLQENYGSLDKNSWNLCQFRFKRVAIYLNIQIQLYGISFQLTHSTEPCLDAGYDVGPHHFWGVITAHIL